MVELNHRKIFPSAFRLDDFHKLNPRRAFLCVEERTRCLPPKSDVITESQIPGKSTRGRTRQGAGMRDGWRKREKKRRRLWTTSAPCSMEVTDGIKEKLPKKEKRELEVT